MLWRHLDEKWNLEVDKSITQESRWKSRDLRAGNNILWVLRVLSEGGRNIEDWRDEVAYETTRLHSLPRLGGFSSAPYTGVRGIVGIAPSTRRRAPQLSGDRSKIR